MTILFILVLMAPPFAVAALILWSRDRIVSKLRSNPRTAGWWPTLSAVQQRRLDVSFQVFMALLGVALSLLDGVVAAMLRILLFTLCFVAGGLSCMAAKKWAYAFTKSIAAWLVASIAGFDVVLILVAAIQGADAIHAASPGFFYVFGSHLSFVGGFAFCSVRRSQPTRTSPPPRARTA
jgi:hypothetical protein